MNIELPLRAFQAQVDIMEQVIRLLVGSLAQPRMRRINSDRGYRFDEPTTHHFCLLKAVRVVSALNASIELARRGYTQEIAVLMRVGLVRLASFIVRDDIAANRLVRVLEEFNPGDIDELHAVYLGQGGLLPIRIRVFLEFLAQQIKIGEARPSREA